MRVIKIIIFCLGFTVMSIGSLEAQKAQNKDNSKSRVIYEENTSFEDALYRAKKVKELYQEEEKSSNNFFQNQGNGKNSDDLGMRLMAFLQQLMGMGNPEDLYNKMMQGLPNGERKKNTGEFTEESFKEWGTRHKWGGLEKETR